MGYSIAKHPIDVKNKIAFLAKKVLDYAQ